MGWGNSWLADSEGQPCPLELTQPSSSLITPPLRLGTTSFLSPDFSVLGRPCCWISFSCVVEKWWLTLPRGPGTLAGMAAKRVASAGKVIATDISAPMLQVARSKPSLAASAPIEYLECAAAPLLVPDEVADVVVCQQGLQFFPDQPEALREMWRVLKPRGRLGITVWSNLQSCTIWSAYHSALVATELDELAQLLLAPFSWGSLESLREAVASARFRQVVASTPSLPIVFEGGDSQVFDALFGQPVGPSIQALPDATRQRLRAAIAKLVAPMMADGRVHGTMTSHLATAEK